MAPSDDIELSEAESLLSDDDGTESEIADNDQEAAVGGEQDFTQAPADAATEAASRPPRQLHNYCLTKSAFLRRIEGDPSAKRSFKAFLKCRLPHYSAAADARLISNQEGASLPASHNSTSISRNSPVIITSSGRWGKFVTLSTPNASAPVTAVLDLLSKSVSDGLNASVHSLSYADAAGLLLWLESRPPEVIARAFSWTPPEDAGKLRIRTLVSVTRFLLGLDSTEDPPTEMLSDMRSLKAAIRKRRHSNEKQASQLGHKSRQGKRLSWIVEITSWGADYMKNLRHQAFQEALENRWILGFEDLEKHKAEMDGRFNELKRKLEERNKDVERKLADSKRGLEQKFEDLAESLRELEQKVEGQKKEMENFEDLAEGWRELEQKVEGQKKEMENFEDLAEGWRELEQKVDGQKKEMAELQLWVQQVMAALNLPPGIQSAGLQH
ncbi:hypothetical protein BDZ91DRAFT_39323 [Kalaharituber pfeilii]|nr:hypothetical protein BDZ91DRAFT_39323 [Kalaharituber pfeilii]